MYAGSVPIFGTGQKKWPATKFYSIADHQNQVTPITPKAIRTLSIPRKSLKKLHKDNANSESADSFRMLLLSPAKKTKGKTHGLPSVCVWLIRFSFTIGFKVPG